MVTHKQFDNTGTELLEFSNANLQKIFAVLGSLATTSTSFLVQQQQRQLSNILAQPSAAGFLTLPNAEQHFETARNVSGALIISYLPVVGSDSYGAWRQYSRVNQDWIVEANADALGATAAGASTTTIETKNFQPIQEDIWEYDETNSQRYTSCNGGSSSPESEIYRRRLSSDSSSPSATSSRRQVELEEGTQIAIAAANYTPIWTFSPPPALDDTRVVNYNLLQQPSFHKAADVVQATRKPTLLGECNQVAWFQVDQPSVKDSENVAEADSSSSSSSSGKDLQTMIVHPIFSDFSATAPIAGFLLAIVPWTHFFKDVLTPGRERVTVVMESGCGGGVFSLDIDETSVNVTAGEDTHNSRYDEMGITEIFYGETSNSGGNDTDTNANANTNTDSVVGDDTPCTYTITVYPTKEMESVYKTANPFLFAMVVVFVFIFTSMFFMLFDCLVQKRTADVMTTALKQNAIVSSLFPRKFQAKILAEVDEHNKLSRNGKAGLKNFLIDVETKKTTVVDKSKPIADLFPETTVMFADISG